jgi:hypothetical protein
MGLPVDLDDQLCVSANEIRDEWPMGSCRTNLKPPRLLFRKRLQMTFFFSRGRLAP